MLPPMLLLLLLLLRHRVEALIKETKSYLDDRETVVAAPCSLALDLMDRFGIMREAQNKDVKGLKPAEFWTDRSQWLESSMCGRAGRLAAHVGNGVLRADNYVTYAVEEAAMSCPLHSPASHTQTQQSLIQPSSQMPAAQWGLGWQACRRC